MHHFPHIHSVHVKNLQRYKKLHMMAQFSYLISEAWGWHVIHLGCTVAVVLGMSLFFLIGEEVEGV